MKRKRRLSKAEMRGFIVLAVVILGITLGLYYKEEIFSNTSANQTLSDQEQQELEQFAQEVKKAALRAQEQKGSASNVHSAHLTPFPFDPNTADSATLSRLGLKDWQISNLLKYRGKGGRWRKAEDFARLYGLSADEFQQLRPYIKIKLSSAELAKAKTKLKRDSIHKSYPKKLKQGTLLSLNTADTTSLKGIPGIGSYYANKICRYRERLGGFVSVSQLKEIEGLPEDIEKWFTLMSNDTIRKTQINKANFKDLVKHPYLNYEQVKVICNYIRKYGKIRSWEDLSNSEHFTEADFERLQPYSSFE